MRNRSSYGPKGLASGLSGVVGLMAFVAWVSGGSSEVPTDLSNLVLDPIPRECEAN
jgi:hypothetical protein